ncbi:MAG: M23 family metallopeptidase [Cyanobacteria bacterium]|nr:M23 family metallopeptidase [Cyanobacteriota bacterium]
MIFTMAAMNDRQPSGQALLNPAAPIPRGWVRLAMLPLIAAPLMGVGLAWGQDQIRPLAQPLRPDPAALPSRPPARFDASLDELVRDGVVSPVERAQILSGSGMTPFNVPAHQQACSSGALSQKECNSGLVVRWRGRINNGEGRLPLPLPLTVPVSALLAGAGGNFRLADVFGVTPRPAPIGGNGNRQLLFPLIGSALTSSNFGYRLHPILGSWLMHAGRDLAAPEGTPVVAALAGRVVSSGLAGGYGLAVEVEHDRPRRRTLYGHLSELFVKEGDRVLQGEVIGRVGSTGLSTGPHLHFELRLPGDGGWVAVDPGDMDPGKGAAGSDAIALLMGQLLQSLERPRPVS